MCGSSMDPAATRTCRGWGGGAWVVTEASHPCIASHGSARSCACDVDARRSSHCVCVCLHFVKHFCRERDRPGYAQLRANKRPGCFRFDAGAVDEDCNTGHETRNRVSVSKKTRKFHHFENVKYWPSNSTHIANPCGNLCLSLASNHSSSHFPISLESLNCCSVTASPIDAKTL